MNRTADPKKSLSMQDKARRLIPGMTQLLSKRPDRFSTGVWPGYFHKASGAHVWDLDGNRYLDMSIGGIGANALGYADPDVDEAVREAIGRGTSCSLNCPEEVELAELLIDLHPWAQMVRYTRSGGEAMTMAVRIARAHTGRDKVAFCGYHGWHDWYLSANLGTENALGDHLIAGLDPSGVPRRLAGTALPFHYNRLDELEDIVSRHGPKLAAIVMEPIRSEPPSPGFLGGVRALADECGAVFIFDEISAGFRLTCGGAHMVLCDDSPDMAVFSKALGNGYPIAAVIGRAEVMEGAQKTFISSTNWTERIGPAAALATIAKHRRLDVATHLQAVGQAVQDGWCRCARRHGLPIEISGLAAMGHFGFALPDAQMIKALFVQRLLEDAILGSTAFYAMYTHTREHVDTYLASVDAVFKLISDALAAGDLRERLRGKPSAVGFQRLS